MYVSATIAIDLGPHTVEVDAHGTMSISGSNGYGSDEPESCEIEGVTLWHPTRNRPLHPALAKRIMHEHDDRITTILGEQD
jgi:hypothetical protein